VRARHLFSAAAALSYLCNRTSLQPTGPVQRPYDTHLPCDKSSTTVCKLTLPLARYKVHVELNEMRRRRLSARSPFAASAVPSTLPRSHVELKIAWSGFRSCFTR
jgi:hypothetical protein